MEKAKKEKKEKEKVCPFNEKLKCEDCRFYRPYLGGGGQKECALILRD